MLFEIGINNGHESVIFIQIEELIVRENFGNRSVIVFAEGKRKLLEAKTGTYFNSTAVRKTLNGIIT